MALATLADLEVVSGRIADAGRAGRLIEMASARVERWCRRSFEHIIDDVLVIDVRDGTLRLPAPVESIDSITGPWPSPTTYAVSGFEVLSDGRLRRERWCWATGTYTVVCTHGYDEIPDDVVAAVCSMVGRVINGPGIGVADTTTGPFRVGYRGDAGAGVVLGDEERAMLRPFRRSVRSIEMTRDR